MYQTETDWGLIVTSIDSFALWQAVYPESYVTPQINFKGTIYTTPGTVEDATTPLMPFARNEDGEMHTARTVRHISDLGYPYPGLRDWEMSPEELIVAVNASVTAMYGNAALWGPPPGDCKGNLDQCSS